MNLIDTRHLPRELDALAPLMAERFAPDAHGHMEEWRGALEALPRASVSRLELGDLVCVDGPLSEDDRNRLHQALMTLHPWRKGPFRLFGIDIATEWRSDWKWRRVRPHLAPMDGHQVLDVGSGNGYFGWRMLEAGAARVVGVDPTLVFCMQHLAVNHYIGSTANHVLPLRFEELPEITFDSVFSMGVVYHRRDPAEHVGRLYRHTAPGGQVVLESLVVEGPTSLVPEGRYARMRNVWVVPTPEQMEDWLTEAGFEDVRLVDVTPTAVSEQRTTDWMRFQSLAEALDPADPSRTIEGHPAPVRAVVVARKPV